MATLSSLSTHSTRGPAGTAALEDADFGSEYRDFVRKVRLGLENEKTAEDQKTDKKMARRAS